MKQESLQSFILSGILLQIEHCPLKKQTGMRRIMYLFFILLIAAGCSKEEQPVLNVAPDVIEFQEEGGTAAFNVSTNKDWVVRVSDSWCKVSMGDGPAGEYSITVSAGENKGYDKRACTITIQAGTLEETVRVSQNMTSAILINEKDKEHFISCARQSFDIKLSTNLQNVKVIVPDTAEWITPYYVKSLKNGTIHFSIAANYDINESRTANVTIASEDMTLSETVTITQRPAPYFKYTTFNGSVLSSVTEVGGVKVAINEYRNGEGYLILSDETSYIGTEDFRRDFFYGVKTIWVHPCIKEIKDLAFHSYTELEKIELPEGLEIIGDEVFRYCESLKEVRLPSTLTSIGGAAFAYCSSLVSIELPSGITETERSIFHSCSNLENVKLPDNLKSLGARAFISCWKLKNIQLPESLEYIGEEAFQGCSLLESVSIPDKVDSIGMCLFSGCYNLVSAKLPASLRHLSYYTFADCEKLVDVTMPLQLATIDFGVFHDCKSLRQIVIPENVSLVFSDAFDGCSLKVISFDPAVPPQIKKMSNKVEMNTATEIKVPAGSLNAYRSSAWGKYYSNFSEK